jgi:hypothetical protein
MPTLPDAVQPAPLPAPRPAGGADPGTRASDAERDAAIGELREHFAAGRMSHETFLYRMNSALGARRQSELPPLFADLPAPKRRRGLLPAGWLSPGWAGSALHRVLGGLPGHAPGTASGPVPHPASGPAPAPARGLTAWFSRAPGPLGPRRSVDAPGPRQAAVLPFPRGAATAFSIGRAPGCDLVIDDITVSRGHARLERTPAGWRLTDLGSTNGTRVNGWLVRDPVEVRAGDLVRFGDAEYTLSESAWGPPLH